MPDLITHGAIGYLLGLALPGDRYRELVIGSLAPDLLARVPTLAVVVFHAHVHALPPQILYAFEPLHTPVGAALSSALLSFFWPEDVRRSVFGTLLAGMWLHIGLDALQSHFGVGQMLLFPLSTSTWELGWIGSEDTVYLAPFLGLLSLIVFWVRRTQRRARG